MADTVSFKRLILQAVLHQVSPMVIRLISVSDQLRLPDFHDIFRAILGWDGNLGYIIRIHGQEFNSFRRKTRSKALHEFELHRQEKFLYICTCGSGICASSIFRMLSKVTIFRFVWAAAVLRLRSFAVVRPGTGS